MSQDCSNPCPGTTIKVYLKDGTCICRDLKDAYGYSLCAWDPDCNKQWTVGTGGNEIPAPELLHIIATLTPEPILREAARLLDAGDSVNAQNLLEMVISLTPPELTNATQWLQNAYSLQLRYFEENLAELKVEADFARLMAEVARNMHGVIKLPELSTALVNAIEKIDLLHQPNQAGLLSRGFAIEAEESSKQNLSEQAARSRAFSIMLKRSASSQSS